MKKGLQEDFEDEVRLWMQDEVYIYQPTQQWAAC